MAPVASTRSRCRRPVLRPDERVQEAGPGAAPEQVDAATPELPCARARQQDAQALVALDEELNLVEEAGQLLHLVDDDQGFPAGQRFPQPLRRRAQLAEGVSREQIDEAGVREPIVQERGLAGLPGPEQEQRPVAERRGEVDDPLVHARVLPNCM
jgi:hypothetical protein